MHAALENGPMRRWKGMGNRPGVKSYEKVTKPQQYLHFSK
jgi:hypothetical protein